MKRGTVTFDRRYWPKEGESVPKKPDPYDLEKLWEDCESQASVFVAEAILNEEPHGHVALDSGDPIIEVWLWTVGGDTLTFKDNLCELIADEKSLDYDRLRSKEQVDDVRERLQALTKLEAAIAHARKGYEALLAQYAEGQK